MTHIRQCKHCKKDFVLKNIAYERRGGGKYCSKKCSKYATKKYEFNETFFDNIDAEEKAYWLGFCMADACNTQDELQIELSSIDEDHLVKMKKSFNATHPIYQRQRNKHKTSILRLSSRYLCNKLSELGCIKNKTFSLQYPKKLPTNFARDFIRGYFDGDGCLYIRKQTENRIWSLYGVSNLFITKIKEVIEQNTELKLHQYKQGKNGHVISIMRKHDIEVIKNYLYKDATIFMGRKRNKFDSTAFIS